MEKDFDFFKNFRTNLQLLRINKGYSATQLASKLKMGEKRITDLEYGKAGRGTPKVEELFLIAKFFDVSAEDIVHRKAKIIF